ncbi:MAG: ABC transporter ATP-binding protein [Gemmatimonadota bacterium]|nr:ABC transporter ATP-binding protein [Gemmatimonadota bacterium]
MTDLAIHTRDVCYRASKRFAIENLSINVPPGAIYGFLGPNGAGKTTTIRLLLGLLRPRSGQITVLGRDMPNESTAVLARTGYIPERPHLYPTLTVAEAITFHSAFYPTWDAAWANRLVKEFSLERGQKIASMSKGETGKLMMLLALAQTPDLLLLDEPTDGLDPVVRRDVLTAVLDYVAHRHATVLISSHLVHELERFCDWVGVMDQGRLVTELPIETFKNGIKRIRVSGAPSEMIDAPFVLLDRDARNGTESWLVRGWEEPMRGYLETHGATVREVLDLDLEEGFVELLRSFRHPEHSSALGES